MNIRTRTGVAIAGVAAGLLAAGLLALTSRSDSTASPIEPMAIVPVAAASSDLITVNGTGTITVTPDTATVMLGVNADAASASAALDSANRQMDALISAIRAAGVAPEDITTSSIYLGNRYDNMGRPNGFSASNNLTVTVRGIDRTGPVIDAAAAGAGDNITLQGVSFSVADPEAVLGQARAAAIENARKRAGEYAEAAGVSVGAIRQISEAGVIAPQPMYAVADGAAARDMAAMPIMAGDQQMSVSVTVVFSMG